MTFIVYRKSDGRIESLSEGPIEHANHLAHIELSISSDDADKIHAGYKPFLDKGAIILKEPEGGVNLREQLQAAKSISDLKELLSKLL